jgi:hypothetical protein
LTGLFASNALASNPSEPLTVAQRYKLSDRSAPTASAFRINDQDEIPQGPRRHRRDRNHDHDLCDLDLFVRQDSQYPNKDFWDIAGIVGTWAAVLVALFFGIGQEVTRRSTADLTAGLLAARLVPALEASLIAASLLVRQLKRYNDDWMKLDNPARQFSEICAACSSARLDVPTSELTALAPLADKCAMRLARAIALIELTSKGIADWEACFWPHGATDDDRRAAALAWLCWIEEARLLLESALATCIAASSEFSTRPS